MSATNEQNKNRNNVNQEDSYTENGKHQPAHTMLMADEETAAEFVNPMDYRQNDPEVNQSDINAQSSGVGFGYVAVILSIISLFYLPVILGAIGLVLGWIAVKGGSKGMGYTAIFIGGFSIVAGLLIYPFF